MPKKINNGDTIEVIGYMARAEHIAAGERATVQEYDQENHKVHVDWWNGHDLVLLDTDPFAVIS